jgi:hypothetical protein
MKGLSALVKSVARLVLCSHCCIYREVLATKVVPHDFQNILNEVVELVNHIESLALNTCLFKALSEETESDSTQLLFDAEIR